jgi:hypothetical protein
MMRLAALRFGGLRPSSHPGASLETLWSESTGFGYSHKANFESRTNGDQRIDAMRSRKPTLVLRGYSSRIPLPRSSNRCQTYRSNTAPPNASGSHQAANIIGSLSTSHPLNKRRPPLTAAHSILDCENARPAGRAFYSAFNIPDTACTDRFARCSPAGIPNRASDARAGNKAGHNGRVRRPTLADSGRFFRCGDDEGSSRGRNTAQRPYPTTR